MTKWLALIFFTTMLTYMYLPRFVFGMVMVVGVSVSQVTGFWRWKVSGTTGHN